MNYGQTIIKTQQRFLLFLMKSVRELFERTMYIFCKDINQQVLINQTDTLSCFKSFSDRTLLNPFLGTERSIHCDFLATYTKYCL